MSVHVLAPSRVLYNFDPRSIPTLLISITYCIQNSSVLILFYDSPIMPAGIFDDFLAIPQLGSDLGTRGMASIVKAGTSGGQISGRWVTKI